jgi:hypothetical protein
MEREWLVRLTLKIAKNEVLRVWNPGIPFLKLLTI